MAQPSKPPAQIQRIVEKYAKQYKVNPNLVYSLMQSEDAGYNPSIKSSAGAIGLMQVEPGTAAMFGISPAQLNIPEYNIHAGVQYLAQQLRNFNGNVHTALRAYNAGPGNVRYPNAGKTYADTILSRLPKNTSKKTSQPDIYKLLYPNTPQRPMPKPIPGLAPLPVPNQGKHVVPVSHPSFFQTPPPNHQITQQAPPQAIPTPSPLQMPQAPVQPHVQINPSHAPDEAGIGNPWSWGPINTAAGRVMSTAYNATLGPLGDMLSAGERGVEGVLGQPQPQGIGQAALQAITPEIVPFTRGVMQSQATDDANLDKNNPLFGAQSSFIQGPVAHGIANAVGGLPHIPLPLGVAGLAASFLPGGIPNPLYGKQDQMAKNIGKPLADFTQQNETDPLNWLSLGMGGAAKDAASAMIQHLPEVLHGPGNAMVQSAHTLLGDRGVIEPLGEAALSKMSQTITDALRGRVGKINVPQNVARTLAQFTAAPDRRVITTSIGNDIVRRIETTTEHLKKLGITNALARIQAEEANLEAGKIAPDIFRLWSEEAWRHGDALMRRKVELLGFKPTAEELKHWPTPDNLTHHRIVHEYFPRVGVNEQMRKGMGLPEDVQSYDNPALRHYNRMMNAAFEASRKSGELPPDLVEAATLRSILGHTTVQNRSAERQIHQLFGIFHKDYNPDGIRPEHADLIDPRANAQFVDPAQERKFRVAREKFIKHVHVIPTEGKQKFAKAYQRALEYAQGKRSLSHLADPNNAISDALTGLSNLGRENFVGVNFLGHSANVTTNAFLSGGIPRVLRAQEFLKDGIPETLMDRLTNGGISATFKGHQSVLASGVDWAMKKLQKTKAKNIALGIRNTVPKTIRKYYDFNSGIVDSVDIATRAAHLEELDHRFPNMPEATKLKVVDDDAGPYGEVNAFTHFLKSHLGAQFPQWHGAIAPSVVGRAMLKNPQRVLGYLRTLGLVNHMRGQDRGTNVHMGTPIDSTNEILPSIAQGEQGMYSKFFGSPSEIGPIASGIYYQMTSPERYKKSLPEALSGRLMDQSTPLNQYADALRNDYHTQDPSPLQRLVNALLTIREANRGTHQEDVIRNMFGGDNYWKAETETSP